jgi:hypothetical protein
MPASRKRSRADPDEELGISCLLGRADLECPVCFDGFGGHIFQCPNGHLLCWKCKTRVSCCPICRSSLGNIRNRALEHILDSRERSCDYHGCVFIGKGRVFQDHLQSCNSRPHCCPVSAEALGHVCGWSGSASEVESHLQTAPNHLNQVGVLPWSLGRTNIYELINPQGLQFCTWTGDGDVHDFASPCH